MLTAESAVTLVHASVTSWVDYCNVVLAGAPKVIINKLQRVMNAALQPGLPWIWISMDNGLWIYPCVDIRLRLHYGYFRGYF